MNIFALSEDPIDAKALGVLLADPTCGAFASFEGWVRNHADGKASASLEYEAFHELAVREGQRIVGEAKQRFGAAHIACVHRVGHLQVGEMAVWVGACAAHRKAAFDACRFVIDEVKHRVPIWKKEHYENDPAGWVNCETQDVAATGQPGTPNVVTPTADYSRQVALPEVGMQGQARLARAKVLVVGAGGLGVPVLSYLAGAGVGNLAVADHDVLEASNLHRQPIYAIADVGRRKAELAADFVRCLNPNVCINAITEQVTRESAPRLCEGYDLVIDCTDNFSAKFAVNDAAVETATPAIFASVYQYEGQLQVFRPDRPNGVCLRCLWPSATQDGVVGTCDRVGTLGPVPAMLGTLQALEALKILLDLPGQLVSDVLLVDLLQLSVTRVAVTKGGRQDHAACRRAAQADDSSCYDEIEVALDPGVAAEKGFQLIDIRESSEVRETPIEVAGVSHVPMEQMLERPTICSEQKVLLCCARGIRSQSAARRLRELGYPLVYSLKGGVQSRR